MCEHCGSNSNKPDWQADYLRRYLNDQRERLDREGHDPETAAQLEKTQWLLDNIQEFQSPGD